MNIPQEAIEAMRCIPLKTEAEDDFVFLAPSQAEGLLQAALPALLADYREKVTAAIKRRMETIGDRCDEDAAKLAEQVNGLRLALSYLDEMTR